MDSEVFEDATLFRTWCWLLMEANWDKRKTRRGETINRGELITGYRKAASVLDISKSTVLRHFRKLESLDMISTRSGTRGTHVLVCKYRDYQASDDDLRDTIWDASEDGTPNPSSDDNLNTDSGTLGTHKPHGKTSGLIEQADETRDADEYTSEPTDRDADEYYNKNKRILKNKRKTYARDFGLFWDVYPRRVAKGKAFAAFKKAARTTDAEIIIEAAAAFGASPKAKGDYCPYPGTWLNGERWLDDPSEWNEGAKPAPFKPKAKTGKELRFEAAQLRLVTMRSEFMNMDASVERDAAVAEWRRCKEILAKMEKVK
jgi:hypothetical protein